MTARTLAVFMAIWLSFGFIGGIVDGKILGGYDTTGGGAHTGDAAALQGALQSTIQSEENQNALGAFLGTVSRGFATTMNFLGAWADMLTLNFSFFTGPYTLVGWVVRSIIGIPMITMLLLVMFGRR